MKFDHIICPVDFSEAAVNAFKFACILAKANDSRVYLVHAYDRPTYSIATGAGGISYAVDSEANAEIQNYVSNEFHKLSSNDFAKDIDIVRQFITDIPAWKFYEKLNLKKADVIVMGTHGRTGFLRGTLFGTNTERVIRRAPIPVISVPTTYYPREVRKLLFATDFKSNLDDIFPAVVSASSVWGAEIVVGMINTRDNFASNKYAQEKFTALAGKNPGVKMRLVVHNHDSAEEGVLELLELEKVDMLAMLTHGRTGISHLIRGSVVENLSGDQLVQVPLLSLKSGEDK